MRRITTLMVILLLTTALPFSISTNNVSSSQSQEKTTNRTLYVGGTGPNNYTTIQDAINDSLDGYTIFVYRGTYGNATTTINKEVTIIGEQENTTKITSGPNRIDADNVTIKNLTFYVGIMSYGSNITIDNCTLKKTGGGTAIDIRNDNVVVENVTITGAYWRGIDCNDYVYYTAYPCSNITIQRCVIENTWQHPYDNPSFAVGYIKENGLITECTFINNSRALYSISNSLICRNNFVSSGIGNVYDNLWNNTYPVGGNYWKHYMGEDNYSDIGQNISGSDGIGDTPYLIVGADPEAYDYYPLINMYCPWDNTPPKIILFEPENNTIIQTGEINVQINVYDIHFRNTSYKINNQEWNITKENNIVFDTAEWIEDGVYNVTLAAVDYNNNRAIVFYSFVIDNIPPSAPGKPTYENDESGSDIDMDGKIVFHWTPASDANLDVYEVWLSINNEPYTHVFDTPHNHTTINGTTGDNYTIAVVAVDKVGLKSTQSPVSETITVNITVILPEIKIWESNQTTTNANIIINWTVIAGLPTSYEISTDGQTWNDIGLVTQHIFSLTIGENTLYVRGKINQYTGTPKSVAVTRKNINQTGENNETKQKTLVPSLTIIIILIITVAAGLIFILIFFKRKKQKNHREDIKHA